MNLLNNAKIQLMWKFIKKDLYILLGMFVIIFVLIFWVGIMFPEVSDNGFYDALNELLKNPLYEFLIGPVISITSIRGWIALGWLSYSWWIGLPLGIYLGVRILSIEVSQGTADQLIVTPISREVILLSRYFISLIELLFIPCASTIGIVVTFIFINEEIPYSNLIAVFLLDYFFFIAVLTITVFFSIILIDLRKIILIVAGFYFVSFFSFTFGGMNPDFEILKNLSIFRTRNVVDVFVTSVTTDVIPNLVFLSIFILVFLILSYFWINHVEIKSRV